VRSQAFPGGSAGSASDRGLAHGLVLDFELVRWLSEEAASHEVSAECSDRVSTVRKTALLGRAE
jgi:hypothetical protein